MYDIMTLHDRLAIYLWAEILVIQLEHENYSVVSLSAKIEGVVTEIYSIKSTKRIKE